MLQIYSWIDTQNRLLYKKRRILINVNEKHQRGKLFTYSGIHNALLQFNYLLYEKAWDKVRQPKVTINMHIWLMFIII